MKKIFFIFLILNSIASFSQKKLYVLDLNDSIQFHIRYRNKLKAKKFINEMSLLEFKDKNEKYLLDKNKYYYHFILKQNDSCFRILNNINLYKEDLNLKNLNNYYINNAYLFMAVNKIDSAASYYLKSLKFYELDTLSKSIDKANIYNGLAHIYRKSSNNEKYLFYLNKNLKETLKLNDSIKISVAYNNLGVYYDKNNQPIKAIKNFKKALKHKQRNNTRNTTLQNIGSIYLNHFNNIDSALYYNKKAINRHTSKRTLAFIHKDLAIIDQRKGNFNSENKNLKIALKSIKLDPFQELEVELYKSLSKNNKELKKYKESVYYLEKYDSLNEVIKNQSLIEKVEDIETKYQTEKKEKENLLLKQYNLESEAENKQKLNLLIAAILTILLGSIIYILSYKNSQRKRKLAEQQKELEAQKNLTLIKEQEITTINAMVNGQEKERKQIAEDLHDNLGSVLATLKLHFENLKFNREKKKINQEELFNKTEGLIDEAYLKVRSIAHAKNAGVIANQGLLIAIQMMAEKISSADRIKIEVIDFGLDKRLENSLEISVFRITQELITNIIKHADANNATINISLYDKNLNIIIEDDGKGFDILKINLKNGMGLNSIKTRIEHLDGSFKVDSTIGKGSSIILDIPIN